MTGSILWRMVWKEYRTQRGLWLMIVGIYLVSVVALVVFLPEVDRPSYSQLLFSAVLTTAFYILASGGVSYAAEREQRTMPWLQTLPLGPMRLLLSKLAWTVASASAALAICAGAAFVMSQRIGIPDDLSRLPILYLYLILITVSCSMLTDNVLKAVGLSAAAGVAVFLLSVVLSNWGIGGEWLLAPLAGAVVGLNHRWMRESRMVTWDWVPRLRGGFTLDRALSLPVSRTAESRAFAADVWCEFRQARGWLLSVAVLAVIVVVLGDVPGNRDFSLFMLSMTVFGLAPMLVGIGTCRGDQMTKRILFRGVRGHSGARLLLIKHLVWGGGLFLIQFGMLAFVHLAVLEGQSFGIAGLGQFLQKLNPDRVSSPAAELQFTAGASLVAYSIGHFFSLLILSGITGSMIGMIMVAVSGAALGWGYRFGIPLFVLCVVPSALYLGLAFVRAGRWLEGRNTFRDLLPTLGGMVLGLLTVLSLYAGWRVVEVERAYIDAGDPLQRPLLVYGIICMAIVAGVAVLLKFAERYRLRPDATVPRQRGRMLTLGRVLGGFLIVHGIVVSGYVWAKSQKLAEEEEAIKAPFIAYFGDPPDRDGRDGIVTAEMYRTANRGLPPIPVTKEFVLSTGEEDASFVPEDESGGYVRPQYEWAMLQFRSRITWSEWEGVPAEQREWLRENELKVEEFLKADARGDCTYRDLTGLVNRRIHEYEIASDTTVRDFYPLLTLVRLKALEYEANGDLESAWRCHLANARFLRRFTELASDGTRSAVMQYLRFPILERDIRRWQARADQTADRLSSAALELGDELQRIELLGTALEVEAAVELDVLQSYCERNPALRILGFAEFIRTRDLIIHEYQRNYLLAEGLRSLDLQLWSGRKGYTDYRIPIRSPGGQAVRVSIRSSDLSEPHYTADMEQLGPAPETLMQLGNTTFPYSKDRNNQRGRPFSLMGDPGTILGSEIEFWNETKRTFAWTVRYLERLERGRFIDPDDVGELSGPAQAFLRRAEQFRLPVYQSKPTLAGLITNDPWRDTHHVEWDDGARQTPRISSETLHRELFPQAEYNFGPAGDAPLTAPKPTEVPE